MRPDSSIQALFEAYAAAFDKLDIKGQAKLFSESFIMAGPKGAVSQTKQEYLEKGEKAVTFYKSVHFSAAKVLSIDVTLISDDYVLAKVHWQVSFGETKQEFEVSYVLHISLPEPRIVLAISHEDEQENMKKLRASA